MELNSNLLNEVIADAKAVKETALQAAIGTLKETFEPQVRRMISQKLAEEGELEDEPEAVADDAPVAEGEYIDDGDDGTPASNLEEMEGAEDETDIDLEEILKELDADSEEDEFEAEPEVAPEVAPVIDEPAPEVEDDDELNMESLDSMIKEMEDEMAGEDAEDATDDMAMENADLKRELAETKKGLKEAYQAIVTQKNVINEVNLLNSKLMFMTKINRKYKLSPDGQLKILESFDRAQTVREVKLVFATISENLAKTKPTKTNKTISESVSKPARVVKPKPMNENFSYAARWKELAGIK